MNQKNHNRKFSRIISFFITLVMTASLVNTGYPVTVYASETDPLMTEESSADETPEKTGGKDDSGEEQASGHEDDKPETEEDTGFEETTETESSEEEEQTGAEEDETVPVKDETELQEEEEAFEASPAMNGLADDASATDERYGNVTEDGSITWRLDGDDNHLTLTISGTGRMPDYEFASDIFDEKCDRPWLAAKDGGKVVSVIIEPGITYIGANAFRPSTPETVSIADTVEEIGDRAFYANFLERLDLPDSLRIIGKYAFADSHYLEEIHIPEGVTEIRQNAFSYCRSLKKITLPKSLSNIGSHFAMGIFYDCPLLEEIAVAPGNAYYTSVDGVLFDQSLRTLYCYPAGKKDAAYRVPDSVQELGEGCFIKAAYLQHIILPEEMIWIGDHAFSYCYRLQTVEIPEGITTCLDWFYYCISLRSVVLPASLEDHVNCLSLDSCRNLTDVYFNGTTGEWVGLSEHANFSARIHCADGDIETGPEGILETGSCGTGLTYEIRREDGLITLIITGSGAIPDYESAGGTPWCKYPVRKVSVGEGITSIGKYAFAMTTIHEVSLPDTLVSIGHGAFQWSAITEITLPYGLKTIDKMAFRFTTLERIVFPDSVTDIAYSSIEDCLLLDSVVFPRGLSILGAEFDGSISVRWAWFPRGIQRVSFFTTSNIKLLSRTLPYSTMTLYLEGSEDETRWLRSTVIEDGYGYTGNEYAWFPKVFNAPVPEAGGVTISTLSVGRSAVTIEENNYAAMQVSSVPHYATNRVLLYSSDDERIAVVDEGGIIRGVSPGTCTVTATATDGSGLSCSMRVTVIPQYRTEVSQVIVSPAEVSLFEGDTTTLIARVVPEGVAAGLAWTSTNERIATVDHQGRITAVSEGITDIVVMAPNGVQAVCVVTVASSDVTEEDIEEAPTGTDGADIWIAGFKSSMEYTGGRLTQSVRVYDGKRRLTENKDYTVSYTNNINAAKVDVTNKKGASIAPAMTIRMKGSYSGTKIMSFAITPISIDQEDGAHEVRVAVANAVYKKNMKLPAPAVTVDGKKLKLNKDYVLSYTDEDGNPVNSDKATAAGTYSVTVTGKGNYTGTVSTTFKLTDNAIAMSKVSVSKIATQQITAEGLADGVQPSFTVTYAKEQLIAGEDGHYTASFENNKEIGTATLILTGTCIDSAGDGRIFAGEKRITFKIKGTALSKVTFTAKSDAEGYVAKSKSYSLPYKGSAWEIGVNYILTYTAVKGGTAETLKEGTDYEISYLKNIKVGTATVVFTGKGMYSGTMKKTFKITPYNLAEDTRLPETKTEVRFAGAQKGTDDEPAYAYVKGGVRPEVKVCYTAKDGTEKVLEKGVDYTVKYVNVTKVAAHDDVNPKNGKSVAPAVIITGKGNFKGTISRTFTIRAQQINRMNVVTTDKVYVNRKGAYIVKPKVYDTNGKLLKEGTDYEKLTDRDFEYRFKENKPIPGPGTEVKVTIRGKGNYEGQTTASYRIIEKGRDISAATFQIDDQTYTGRPILLNEDDFTTATIKIDGKTEKLRLGEDYEIVSYTANVQTGKAKVTLRGISKGMYGRGLGGTKTVTFKIVKKQIPKN